LLFAGALRRDKLRRVSWAKGVEFFLQAEIGDNPFDAARTDGQVLLADFLGDDHRRGLWIQEATADDQAHDLVGAAVIGLGAGRL